MSICSGTDGVSGRRTGDREVAVRLPASSLSHNDSEQIIHTRASVSKQCDLVLAEDWRFSVARKVTAGLAKN